ncbi:HAD family hydrolase [Solimicrobium silvestre]|uniref:phosphoglycolate phosphatase n=1 Tax=Solimicrobium silvestre TaxID=2099400 RepID=A0A2S9GZ72_9BURK|nr:HAD-IA family hydrolase [Solimicrobium silvestre]PRC92998.1 Phosphoglycolate phosphatase, bacterial [Solimicrobium silvestre]
MKSLGTIRAVLFDLDGTLADTAPDLAAAVNLMRTQRKLEPAPYAQLRPHASAGARGLLGAGFGVTPHDAEFDAMRIEFLNNYEAAICQHSSLFDGIAELLQTIIAHGIPWGIVTNKAARFTQPLVPLLGLQHASCVISGDTTAHSKPHPEPLLEAARQLQLAPQDCCYLGDDLRDIQAAQAAGMRSIAAAWGYCGQTEPEQWQADLLLYEPSELLKFII